MLNIFNTLGVLSLADKNKFISALKGFGYALNILKFSGLILFFT